MSADMLAARAARFHDVILDVAYGPGGMIVSFPRLDTRRPFQEGDLGTESWLKFVSDAWDGYTYTPRPTLAELWYGENTLWVTGLLLWSQMLRHQATQEPEALTTARKCFLDLHNIFRLCREIEPGLLGKPHGGRAGPTTSFDQSACPVLFYAWYARDYAAPQEKAEAIENLRDHGKWYLRRNMVMNHHGHLHYAASAYPSFMKYLAAMYAAYELSGETDVRDAVKSYLQRIVNARQLPWPGNPFVVSHNLFYWGLLCDYWHSTDLADMADWISHIGEYWRAAQTALDGEGLLLQGHYDTVAKSFTPYPDRWLRKEDAAQWPAEAPQKAERVWISSTCFPNRASASGMTAYLGLLAQSHGLDDRAHEMAKRTLVRITENDLGWWWNDGKIPDELKPLLNVFAPESAAMWLVAYWRGRLQGVW